VASRGVKVLPKVGNVLEVYSFPHIAAPRFAIRYSRLAPPFSGIRPAVDAGGIAGGQPPGQGVASAGPPDPAEGMRGPADSQQVQGKRNGRGAYLGNTNAPGDVECGRPKNSRRSAVSRRKFSVTAGISHSRGAMRYTGRRQGFETAPIVRRARRPQGNPI